MQWSSLLIWQQVELNCIKLYAKMEQYEAVLCVDLDYEANILHMSSGIDYIGDEAIICMYVLLCGDRESPLYEENTSSSASEISILKKIFNINSFQYQSENEVSSFLRMTATGGRTVDALVCWKSYEPWGSVSMYCTSCTKRLAIELQLLLVQWIFSRTESRKQYTQPDVRGFCEALPTEQVIRWIFLIRYSVHFSVSNMEFL